MRANSNDCECPPIYGIDDKGNCVNCKYLSLPSLTFYNKNPKIYNFSLRMLKTRNIMYFCVDFLDF